MTERLPNQGGVRIDSHGAYWGINRTKPSPLLPMLDQFSSPQELPHQLPQPVLPVGEPVISVGEEVELDLLEGAADGEIEDALPGDGGVELTLQEEAGGAVAGEQGVEGVGAEILDQRPAELAGDELVAEMDAARLLPGAGPLRAGPGEEPLVQLERRGDVEAGHDLLRMEQRVPE